MGLFDERVAYKPFEYPEYYTEGWLKQAQAFWLHTEISMQSDIKIGMKNLTKKKSTLSGTYFLDSRKPNALFQTIGPRTSYRGFLNTRSGRWR